MPPWHYLAHSFWMQSAGGSEPADTLSQWHTNPHDQQEPEWEAQVPQQHQVHTWTSQSQIVNKHPDIGC